VWISWEIQFCLGGGGDQCGLVCSDVTEIGSAGGRQGRRQNTDAVFPRSPIEWSAVVWPCYAVLCSTIMWHNSL